MKFASEITVEGFIATDLFVCEAQSRKDALLLEPENSTDGAGKEDSFDDGKGGMLLITSYFSPLCFSTHSRHRLDCIKQIDALFVVVDARVNQQGIGLVVNIFHHKLKATEKLGLQRRDFIHEVLTHVVGCNFSLIAKKPEQRIENASDLQVG